jgi:hypothetical protein
LREINLPQLTCIRRKGGCKYKSSNQSFENPRPPMTIYVREGTTSTVLYSPNSPVVKLETGSIPSATGLSILGSRSGSRVYTLIIQGIAGQVSRLVIHDMQGRMGYGQLPSAWHSLHKATGRFMYLRTS